MRSSPGVASFLASCTPSQISLASAGVGLAVAWGARYATSSHNVRIAASVVAGGAAALASYMFAMS